MSRKVRIAQLSCGPEYSGVQKEIYEAAESVDAEVFFPDIALADVERAVDAFGLDVRSADLKLMIARGKALVDGTVDARRVEEHRLGLGVVAHPEDARPRGLRLVGNDRQLGADQAVEQRGLAGIGIPNQRHDGNVRFSALLPVAIAVLTDFIEFLFKPDNFFLDFPPIHFQLGFAGPTQTDSAHAAGPARGAACLPCEVRPGSGQPGQAVAVLRQFHLQHPFACVGVVREDIQNQSGAVDNALAASQFLFEFALVARRELVIKENDFRVQLFSQEFDLFKFASAYIGAGIRHRQSLRDLPHNLQTRGFAQQFQLSERIIQRKSGVQSGSKLHPNHQSGFGRSFGV